MELKDAIDKRTSIRNFTNEAVKKEDLKEMVRRAGRAPSENNHQPWKFIVITNKDVRHNMANKVSEKIQLLPETSSKYAQLIKAQIELFATFFEKAPSVIALSMMSHENIWNKGVNIPEEELKRMHNYPDLQAAGAAIQNILLSAVDMGYAACWMSSPLTARPELEQILGISPPWNLIAFVAIGKAASQPYASNKKPLDEIIEFIE